MNILRYHGQPLLSEVINGYPDGNQENTDLYDCLGVSTSATTAEIVAAYRACAREVADFPTSHPKYKLIKKVNQSHTQSPEGSEPISLIVL